MFNFDLDYFLLNLFPAIIKINNNNKLSFGRKKEKYIWICFIVFTFVLGSRYLRGNDYLRYQHTFLYDDDESQIIFTAINRFLRGIGIGKYYFLYIYSIPFIVCALTFMKNLKIYARYLFPAFLLSFIFFNEYCIRQALGFSFVFMYMYYLFEKDNTLKNENVYKKWIFCLFYAILAYGIHSVNALSIAIITIIYIFSFTTISWKLSILGYIFAAFFFMSFFDWSYLENALMLIGGISDKFSAYTNRGVLFFSENAFQEDYSRSTLGQLCSAISHCSLFYLGDKTIRSKCNSRMFYTLFNVYVVGTIFDIGFWNFELIRRVFDPMLSFWCFIFSFVLVHRKEMQYSVFDNLLLLMIPLSFIRDYLSYLLERGDMTLFIWDI